MLLENPSTYLAFSESTFSEIDFIAEVVARTGCALLLDVNNVFISSTNHQLDPIAYIDAFPLAHVQEIHLAGIRRSTTRRGDRFSSTRTTARWPNLSGTYLLIPSRRPGQFQASSNGTRACQNGRR